MPPKTCTCVICGNEVSKRQSYAFNGGRACKEHEQASEKAEERYQKQVKQQKQVAYEYSPEFCEKRYEDMKAESEKKQAEDEIWQMTHCWACGVEGVSPKSHLLSMQVAISRKEGVVEMFRDPKKFKEEYLGYTKNLEPLDYFSYAGSLSSFKLIDRVNMQAYLSGFVTLCKKCAKKNGYDFEKPSRDRKEKTDKTLDRMGLEGLMLLGSSARATGYFKPFEKVAKELDEMEGENDIL